jgi:hypothetical protein
MADYRISYDEQGHSNGMTFRMCLQEATLKLAELAKGISEATNPATTINTVDITFNYLEHAIGKHNTFRPNDESNMYDRAIASGLTPKSASELVKEVAVALNKAMGGLPVDDD